MIIIEHLYRYVNEIKKTARNPPNSATLTHRADDSAFENTMGFY